MGGDERLESSTSPIASILKPLGKKTLRWTKLDRRSVAYAQDILKASPLDPSLPYFSQDQNNGNVKEEHLMKERRELSNQHKVGQSGTTSTRIVRILYKPSVTPPVEICGRSVPRSRLSLKGNGCFLVGKVAEPRCSGRRRNRRVTTTHKPRRLSFRD
jgi:hypothetical protein